MKKTKDFTKKVRKELKKFLSSLNKKQYDLFNSFEYTQKGKEILEKYLEKLEVLKPKFSKEEYEDIKSSITEHFYIVLKTRTKNKKDKEVNAQMIEKIASELGDPRDFLAGEKVERIEKIQKDSVGKIILKICWTITKLFIIFLLFVSLYIPIIISLLSVSIAGAAMIIFWLIDPSNLLGESVAVFSALGWLTPIFSAGITFLSGGLAILTLALVIRIHFKKKIWGSRLISCFSLLLGVVFIVGPILGFVVLNKENIVQEENLTYELDQVERLEIGEVKGDLEIIGTDEVTDEIEIKVKKSATGYTEEDALHNLENINFDIQENVDVLALSSTYISSIQELYHYERIEIEMRVPKDLDITFTEYETNGLVHLDILGYYRFSSNVTLRNLTTNLDINFPSGSLILENIQNDHININHKFGSIKLVDIETSEVRVDTNSGSLTLENIEVQESIDLKSKFGSIEVSNVVSPEIKVDQNSGGIDIENIEGDVNVNQVFGDIKIDSVTGSASIKTNSGSIAVQNTEGNVTIDSSNGDIYVENVAGDLKVKNSSGAIEARSLKATVDIENVYGDIQLEFDIVTPKSENKVYNNSGSIEVKIPPSVSPIVYTSSVYGSIENEYRGEEGSENSPTFVIDIENGSIEVTKK
jgi:DUF4097 and DUF4098 domain-containing protein YvlB